MFNSKKPIRRSEKQTSNAYVREYNNTTTLPGSNVQQFVPYFGLYLQTAFLKHKIL